MINNRLVSLVAMPLLAAFCGCAGTAAPAEGGESAATVKTGQVEQAVGGHVPATGPIGPFDSRESVQRMIVGEAARHGAVAPTLALAVARTASGFAVDALGATGATGVMQVSPEIAARAMPDGETPAPVANVRAALDHLADLLVRYDGDWTLALSHFRGGALQAVDGDTGYRPHAYTRAFVDEVRYWERQYRRDPIIAAWIRQANGLPRFVDNALPPTFEARRTRYTVASPAEWWTAIGTDAEAPTCGCVGRPRAGGRWQAVGTGARFR